MTTPEIHDGPLTVDGTDYVIRALPGLADTWVVTNPGDWILGLIHCNPDWSFSCYSYRGMVGGPVDDVVRYAIQRVAAGVL